MESKSSFYTLEFIGVVFIILKLFKLISLSWLWVLSPFWIGWLVILVLLLVAFLKDKHK